MIVFIYINLRSQALAAADPRTTRQFTEMINLGSHPYQNLKENKMDLMFGFFEKETRDHGVTPIALPEEYGTFTLLIGGQVQNVVECMAGVHFPGVQPDEQRVNFFPDARLSCLDTPNIDLGGSGFIRGQLREIEIQFNPCLDATSSKPCESDRDFFQFFDNKVFYIWSAGNYLDPRAGVETPESLKQRMVYQLALETTLGHKSEVFYELNMSEVKISHEGDQAFGEEKPEP